MTFAWLGLIFVQVLLGAATIWSNKAADFATGHVLIGALSLAVGSLLSVVSFQQARSRDGCISPVLMRFGVPPSGGQAAESAEMPLFGTSPPKGGTPNKALIPLSARHADLPGV
jgi:hypothetical protein